MGDGGEDGQIGRKEGESVYAGKESQRQIPERLHGLTLHPPDSMPMDYRSLRQVEWELERSGIIGN